MQFLVFRWSDFSNWSPWQIQLQTPSLLGQWNHSPMPPAMPISLHCHLNQANLRIATSKAYTSFQCFCNQCCIQSFPSSSLTLSYFCVRESHRVFYYTLKVYLSGIQLRHIEEGFRAPALDPSLQLACRARWPTRTRLPITINLLCALKHALHQSHYSLAEQRMLWATFTLAFYGFQRTSEYINLHCLTSLIQIELS